MRSEIIKTASRGTGISEALAMTEKLASESGLEKKPVLHMRLLAEELFGMLRSIAGDAEADYWIETEGKSFELHLKSGVEMTREMRQQLLSASTRGENAAARGFMGKIRDLITAALLPRENGPSGFSVGLMGLGSPGGYRAGSYEWNMKTYKSAVADRTATDGVAAEAWDELEKSIVARIADDVKIGIDGDDVELTVYKTFA